MNGVSRSASASDDRAVNRLHELGDATVVQLGHRRVRAHAAGVGTGVAVAHAAVVARLGQREHVASVDDREHGQLLALEQFLDHELVAERRDRAQRRVELLLGVADEHALAGREPIGLDHARHPRHRHRLGDRHPSGAHHVLGEALRALDPCRSGARAEHGDAAPAQLIRHTRDERRLGADHDEARADRPGELEQAVAVLGADRVALPQLRDAGIAGRGMNLVDRRAPRELPGQRMLPSAGADDEDSHGASLISPTRV